MAACYIWIISILNLFMPTKKTKTIKKKPVTKSGVKRAVSKKAVKLTKSVSSTKKKGKIKVRGRELFTTPRGTHDVLPVDALVRNKIIDVASGIARYYGFDEIRTPILEHAELFTRGVGESTDIVEKEMYTLKTRGGDVLALRPEGTAPVVRAYLNHGMYKLPQPQKFYYVGPFFRYERPQAGRYRQFDQIGFEIIGSDNDPIHDAEVIVMFYRTIEELKMKSLIIQINSIGCRVCRPGYKSKLVSYYKDQEVCNNCERRMKSNPLRLLDCKKESCQDAKVDAPSILDSLCSSCRGHLKDVLEYLEELELPYMLNPFLVRGLDYYNKTVFEIFTEDNNLALVSGGRYDYLAEMIGGRSTSAGGGAMGIDRILEIMRVSDPEAFEDKVRHRVSLVHIGELARKKSLPLMEELRRNGIPIFTSFGKQSLSHQLEVANKANVKIALILGQKEVYDECIIIRNMQSGVQESVPITKVVSKIKKRLNS